MVSISGGSTIAVVVRNPEDIVDTSLHRRSKSRVVPEAGELTRSGYDSLQIGTAGAIERWIVTSIVENDRHPFHRLTRKRGCVGVLT